MFQVILKLFRVVVLVVVVKWKWKLSIAEAGAGTELGKNTHISYFDQVSYKGNELFDWSRVQIS
jgi:hypothetical protein